MKRIVLPLLLLALIGGAVGTYLYTKPLDSTTKMKAAYTLEPSTLLTAFEDDEASANAKYLDKVIAVKGQVLKVEKANDKTTVYLETDNLMSSVIFQMEEATAAIETGDVVTLKGICTGYLMDVVLVRAVIA